MLIILILRFRQGVHLAGLGQYFSNLSLPYNPDIVIHLHGGTGLVNEVYSLVGQETVIDMLGTRLNGESNSLVGILHPMKLLITGFQLPDDSFRLLDSRLENVYLLEPPYESFGT